jgi:hypothetical protein
MLPVGEGQAFGVVAGHVSVPHTPFWHAIPIGQALAQPPQFAGSDFGSVQIMPPAVAGHAIGAVAGQFVIGVIPWQTPI